MEPNNNQEQAASDQLTSTIANNSNLPSVISFTHSRLILLGSAFAIIMLLLGGGLGILVDPYMPTSMSNTKKGLASGHTAGFAEAKAKFENSIAGKGIKKVTNTRNLSGKVTSTSGNSISLSLHTNDPFVEPSALNKTVFVTASTTITLVSVKVQEKRVNTSEGVKTTPSVLEFSTITGGALQKGDNLTIFLSAETMNLETPTALAIQVSPRTNVYTPDNKPR